MALPEVYHASRQVARRINADSIIRKNLTDNPENFITHFAQSLAAGTFVKLTLGNYKGAEEHLQKILFRLIEVKGRTRVFVQYRYDTRDVVKNHDFDEGITILRKRLEEGFRSGHLFTTENDYQLDIGKRSTRLNIGRPTFKKKPVETHDRKKASLVDPNAYYLRLLGITNDEGKIRSRQHDKWKQINKFVEVLGGLLDKSRLAGKKSLRIVDMGSGKGYLTFAAYDYFRNSRGLEVEMIGVDLRREQIILCNEVAEGGGYSGLRFEVGSIADFEPGDVDVLIALHACDTATDEAIFKGITANAEIIVVAPCCHKEIRHRLKPPEMFRDILKHGIMLERMSETITDGLRSLLLEKSGYSTKLFEFVPTEHTPKNNMIAAVRKPNAAAADAACAQIDLIKNFYGISNQTLDTLLA